MFEEEVFEISDFTTSSDWERFISSLEEIVRQWDLANRDVHENLILKKGAFIAGNWKQRYETIKFRKVSFVLEHHYLEENNETTIKRREMVEDSSTSSSDEQHKDVVALPIACVDLMSRDNDFPPRVHCLARWYGLREFIILYPSAHNDCITHEDKSKLLLSSACIALHNTLCCVPFFVQLHQRQRKLYQGVCQSGQGMRTHFDMVHFKDIPGPYRYVSELLNLFKDKLASPLIENPPCDISIRLSFRLNEWPNGWLYGRLHNFVPSDEDVDEEMEERDEHVGDQEENHNELPFGCSEEPILEMHVGAVWPQVNEEMIVDSAVHSDLDAIQAPIWFLKVIFKEALTCSLSDSMHFLEALKTSRHAKEQVLGKFYAQEVEQEEIEFKSALFKLTNPNPLSVQLPSFNPLMKWNRPKWIKENCMGFIFNKSISDKSDMEGRDNSLDNDLCQIKSAPFNSLTWRIALTLCNVHYKYKELADLAHLWKEIICELRNFWDNGYALPLIDTKSTSGSTSAPDMSACVFHQKLQLLSCCIEQKRKREKDKEEGKEEGKVEDKLAENEDSTVNSTQSASLPKDQDSDDEFYDCPEEMVDVNATDVTKMTPEGRLTQCGTLTLLNSPNEPLYVPITQDPPPMTEDMMQENSRILSQLGTSAESAALRAKMQCASLLSDMQAFKAANPGSIIEDFIRWHSPRDWIESDDGSKGQLSPRMQNPSNLWHEIWDSAVPIPVSKQKRLFDDTKEAEKVLHYFTSISIEELVELLMPILIKSGIKHILKTRQELGLLKDEIEFPLDAIIMSTNDSNFENAIKMMRESELELYNFQSLIMKFQLAHDLEFGVEKVKDNEGMKKYVLKVMSDAEVDVPKAGFGYFGKLIRRMFHESMISLYESRTSVGERMIINEDNEGSSQMRNDNEKLSLPKPFGKEFIFRVSIPRPFVYSKELPQRMYCSLTSNDFRLCGAFTQDNTYF